MSSEQSSGRTNKGFALILGSARAAGLGAPHSNDAILAENGVEFFWIHPFAHVDDRFIGQINNTPRSAVNLKMGDTVTFVKNEIVDWMYLDAGRMKGNTRHAPSSDQRSPGIEKLSCGGWVWILSSEYGHVLASNARFHALAGEAVTFASRVY